MSKKDICIQALKRHALLPLFYHDDPSTSLEVIRALYAGGVRVVEYTNRGVHALRNFEHLRKTIAAEMADMYLGIGTIRTTAEAEAFVAAGADFVVCPVVNAEIGDYLADRNILWIPGCMTPTEIDLASRHGAAIVKLFPGNILGPQFLKAVREIFPDIRFMPTGGVEPEESNLHEWFSAGAVAVGMGSKLIPKNPVSAEEFRQLTETSSRLVGTVSVIKERTSGS